MAIACEKNWPDKRRGASDNLPAPETPRGTLISEIAYLRRALDISDGEVVRERARVSRREAHIRRMAEDLRAACRDADRMATWRAAFWVMAVALPALFFLLAVGYGIGLRIGGV